jgi:probable rRNA maturation factor
MFNYNLINSEDITFKINKDILDDIFSVVWKIVNKPQNGTLNIVFLSPEEVKQLNKVHRDIDKTTDVLSFHYFDDFSNLENFEIAWEIILNQDKIITQWEEFWLGIEKEFYKLVIHSCLHILWYDHEEDSDYEIMKNLEDKIWVTIFEK